MGEEEAKELLGKLGLDTSSSDGLSDKINILIEASNKQKDSMIELTKYKELETKLQGYKGIKDELEKLKANNNKDLSEHEKTRLALEQAQKDVADLKRSNILAEVKNVFSSAGIKPEDYSSYVENFVKDDLKASLESANNFVESTNKMKEQLEKDLREKLLNETPSGDGGNSKNDSKSKKDEKAEKILGLLNRKSDFSKNIKKYL